jgi:hypothetical protein
VPPEGATREELPQSDQPGGADAAEQTPGDAQSVEAELPNEQGLLEAASVVEPPVTTHPDISLDVLSERGVTRAAETQDGEGIAVEAPQPEPAPFEPPEHGIAAAPVSAVAEPQPAVSVAPAEEPALEAQALADIDRALAGDDVPMLDDPAARTVTPPLSEPSGLAAAEDSVIAANPIEPSSTADERDSEHRTPSESKQQIAATVSEHAAEAADAMSAPSVEEAALAFSLKTDLTLGPQDDPGDLFEPASEAPAVSAEQAVSPEVPPLAAAASGWEQQQEQPAASVPEKTEAQAEPKTKAIAPEPEQASANSVHNAAPPLATPSSPAPPTPVAAKQPPVQPRAAVPPAPAGRTAPNDPLAALRALSEEEKIALFS